MRNRRQNERHPFARAFSPRRMAQDGFDVRRAPVSAVSLRRSQQARIFALLQCAGSGGVPIDEVMKLFRMSFNAALLLISEVEDFDWSLDIQLSRDVPRAILSERERH